MGWLLLGAYLVGVAITFVAWVREDPYAMSALTLAVTGAGGLIIGLFWPVWLPLLVLARLARWGRG